MTTNHEQESELETQQTDVFRPALAAVGRLIWWLVRVGSVVYTIMSDTTDLAAWRYFVLLLTFLSFFHLAPRKVIPTSTELDREQVAARVGQLSRIRCVIFDLFDFASWLSCGWFDSKPVGKFLFGGDFVFVEAWKLWRPAADRMGSHKGIYTSWSLTTASSRSAFVIGSSTFASFGKHIPVLWLELFVVFAYLSDGAPELSALVALTKVVVDAPGSPLSLLSLIGLLNFESAVVSFNLLGMLTLCAALWSGFDVGYFFGMTESEAVPGARKAVFSFKSLMSKLIGLACIVHVSISFVKEGGDVAFLYGVAMSMGDAMLKRLQDGGKTGFPYFEFGIYFSIGYLGGLYLGDRARYAGPKAYSSMIFSWQGALGAVFLAVANSIAPFKTFAMTPLTDWSVLGTLVCPALALVSLGFLRHWLSGSILVHLRSSPVQDYAESILSSRRFFSGCLLRVTPPRRRFFLQQPGGARVSYNTINPGVEFYDHGGAACVHAQFVPTVQAGTTPTILNGFAQYEIHAEGRDYEVPVEEMHEGGRHATARMGNEILTPVVNPAAVAQPIRRATGGVLSGSSLELSCWSTANLTPGSVAGSFGDFGLPVDVPYVLVRAPLSASRMRRAISSLLIWDANVLNAGNAAELSFLLCNSQPGDLIAATNDVAAYQQHVVLIVTAGNYSRYRVPNHLSLPFLVGDGAEPVVNLNLTVPAFRGGAFALPQFGQVVNYDPTQPPHPFNIVLRNNEDVSVFNREGRAYLDAIDQTPPALQAVAVVFAPQIDASSSLTNGSAWVNAAQDLATRITRIRALPLTSEEVRVLPSVFLSRWAGFFRPIICYLFTRQTLVETLCFVSIVVLSLLTLVDASMVAVYNAAARVDDVSGRFSDYYELGGISASSILALRATPTGVRVTCLSLFFGQSNHLVILTALAAAVLVLYTTFQLRPMGSIAVASTVVCAATVDVTAVASFVLTLLAASASYAISVSVLLRMFLVVVGVVKVLILCGTFVAPKWEGVFDYIASACWLLSSTSSGAGAGLFQFRHCNCGGGGMPNTREFIKFCLAFDGQPITVHTTTCNLVCGRGGDYYGFTDGHPVNHGGRQLPVDRLVHVDHNDGSTQKRFSVDFASGAGIDLSSKVGLVASTCFFMFAILGGFAHSEVVFVSTIAVLSGSFTGFLLIVYFSSRMSGSCYPMFFDTDPLRATPSRIANLFGAPICLATRQGELDEPVPDRTVVRVTRYFYQCAIVIMFADVFLTHRVPTSSAIPVSGLITGAVLMSSSVVHEVGVQALVKLLSSVSLPVTNRLMDFSFKVSRPVNRFANSMARPDFDAAWAACVEAAEFAVELDQPGADVRTMIGFVGDWQFVLPKTDANLVYKASVADFNAARDLTSRFGAKVPGFAAVVDPRGQVATGVAEPVLRNEHLNVFAGDYLPTVTGRALPAHLRVPYATRLMANRVFEPSIPGGNHVGFKRLHVDTLAAALFLSVLWHSFAGLGNGVADVSPYEAECFITTTSNFNLQGTTTPHFSGNVRDALDNPRTWLQCMSIVQKMVNNRICELWPSIVFPKFEVRVVEKADALGLDGVFDRDTPNGKVPHSLKECRIITVPSFFSQLVQMMLGPVVKLLMRLDCFDFVNEYADGANPNNANRTMLSKINRYTRACADVGGSVFVVSADVKAWDARMGIGLYFLSFLSIYATTHCGKFFATVAFLSLALSLMKAILVGATIYLFIGQMSSGSWMTSIGDTVGRRIMFYGGVVWNAVSNPVAKDTMIAAIRSVMKLNPWTANMDLDSMSAVQLCVVYFSCRVTGGSESIANRDRTTDSYRTIMVPNKGDDCPGFVFNYRVDPSLLSEDARTHWVGRRAKRDGVSLCFMLNMRADSGFYSHYGMSLHHTAESSNHAVACSMEFVLRDDSFIHSTSVIDIFLKLMFVKNPLNRFTGRWLQFLDQEAEFIPLNLQIDEVLLEYLAQVVATFLSKSPTSKVGLVFISLLVKECNRRGLTFRISNMEVFLNNMRDKRIDLTGVESFADAVQKSGMEPGSFNDFGQLLQVGLTEKGFEELVGRMLGHPAGVLTDQSLPATSRQRTFFVGATGSGKTTTAVNRAVAIARAHDLSIVFVAPNSIVAAEVAQKFRVAGFVNVNEDMSYQAVYSDLGLKTQGKQIDPGAPGARVVNVINCDAFMLRLARGSLQFEDFVVVIDEAQRTLENLHPSSMECLKRAAALLLAGSRVTSVIEQLVTSQERCTRTTTNILETAEWKADINDMSTFLRTRLTPDFISSCGFLVIRAVSADLHRRITRHALGIGTSFRGAVDYMFTVRRGVVYSVHRAVSTRVGFVLRPTGEDLIDLRRFAGKVVVVLLDNSAPEGMNIIGPAGGHATTLVLSAEKCNIYGTMVGEPPRRQRSFERSTGWYASAPDDIHQTASRYRGDSSLIVVNFQLPQVKPVSCPPLVDFGVASPAFESVCKYLKGVDRFLLFYFCLVTRFASRGAFNLDDRAVYILSPFLELCMRYASDPAATTAALNQAYHRRGHGSMAALFDAFSGRRVEDVKHPSLIVLPTYPLQETLEDAAWYAAEEFKRLDNFGLITLKSATDKGGNHVKVQRISPCGVELVGGHVRAAGPVFTVRPPSRAAGISGFFAAAADVFLG